MKGSAEAVPAEGFPLPRERPSLTGYLDRRPDLLGWLLAGPVFILTVGIYVYPILYGFLISLYDVHMLSRGLPQFVAMLQRMLGAQGTEQAQFLGLGNYLRVFGDAQLQKAIVASLILTAISVPLNLA